jgi:hypothetical protein
MRRELIEAQETIDTALAMGAHVRNDASSIDDAIRYAKIALAHVKALDITEADIQDLADRASIIAIADALQRLGDLLIDAGTAHDHFTLSAFATGCAVAREELIQKIVIAGESSDAPY